MRDWNIAWLHSSTHTILKSHAMMELLYGYPGLGLLLEDDTGLFERARVMNNNCYSFCLLSTCLGRVHKRAVCVQACEDAALDNSRWRLDCG